MKRVRIVSCRYHKYWYNNRIGVSYYVTESDSYPNDWTIAGCDDNDHDKYLYGSGMISKVDGIVVEYLKPVKHIKSLVL